MRRTRPIRVAPGRWARPLLHAGLGAWLLGGAFPARALQEAPPAPAYDRIVALPEPTSSWPPTAGLAPEAEFPVETRPRGAEGKSDATSPDRWLEASRRAIARFGPGVWPEETLWVDRVTTPRVTYVRYRQSHDGLPILGTSLVLSWHRSGALAHARARWYAELETASARAPVRWIAPEAARESFVDDLKSAGWMAAPPSMAWEAPERAWMPWRDGSGTLGLRPVWILRATEEESPERWEAWVDAESGEVLSRRDRTAYAEAQGRILGAVEPATAGDPQQIRPFANLAVEGFLGTAAARDTSDAQGLVRLDWSAAGSARIVAELRGAYAWVRDASRGLSTPLDTLTAAAPGSFELRWDDANSTAAQRDAYYHANRARDLVRALDPGLALRRLDQPMQVRVDDPSGACNAYWNGSRLNFYAQGSGCVAAARVADVVYHEYGHAVSDLCYAPYPIPADMNEAFSDYFAATLTNQPNIGLGFFGPGTRIREVERDRVWPQDAHPSPHLQGLILAGALWDLRKQLGAARTDSLFHFARYAAAQSFDEYLLDLLVQDDDDGDLDDGTPDFDAIVGAFRAHGIGDYSVVIEHDRLPDVESPGPEIAATARVRSLLPLAPDSLAFAFSTGGPFTRQRPAATGERRSFRAAIPAPAPGTVVRYYWSAADTAGNRAVLPAGAPEECFSFVVGTDASPPQIAHEPLESVAAGSTRLSLHARISDNSDRLGPLTARLFRAGSADTAFASFLPHGGAGARRAELTFPPAEEGETLSYVIEALDGARLPNRTTWPAEGRQRLSVRRGRGHDFETGPGDLVSEEGWRWGAPAEPVTAWSGDRLWAVSLAGPYASNQSAALVWGPLDLRGWTRARLEFRHEYRTESGYDGGRVEWSSLPDGPWTPLTPRGGYPLAWVRALEGPGFSGDSRGWREASFPLDRFVGESVWIRFRFESDARVEDLGWFLDDLALLGAQCRSAPPSLRAEECGADCIRLRWSAPADIDTASARFLGYRIRRALEDGPFGEPLHAAPLRALEHDDRGLLTGRTYRYRLTAVYDEGESEAREAARAPFAPSLRLEPGEIAYELRGVARSDTVFRIENGTGGTLRFNTYLGGPGSKLDDLRLRYRRGTAIDWVPLWSDASPREGTDPALAELSVRDRSDEEIGPVLEVRLRGAASWGDPRNDWGGLVWIDTDDNLATGRIATNLGAEYLAAFGRAARDAGHDGPAALLGPSLRPLYGLTGVALPAGADSVLLAIPWALIGSPSEVRLRVTLSRGLAESPFQTAPDEPELPWLSREPRHGRAVPGHPQPCELSFDATRVGNGTYRAVLALESNDPIAPERIVPVTLRVRDLLPAEPLDLAFVSNDRGLEVSFRLSLDPRPEGVAVERSDADPVRWSRRTEQPLLPDSTGRVRFEDRAVEPGNEYLYRFRVRFPENRFLVYGPYASAYLPEVPARLALWPPRPNPWRFGSGEGILLRADLPSSGHARVLVVDVAGRIVRRLADRPWTAGPRWIRWDGRDDRGEPVRAGSYWIALQAPGGARSVRAVVLR